MPRSLAPLILGRWGGQERRRNKRTEREVGSETVEAARGALKLYCHNGLCCWAVGLVLEEGPPPFSVSLVSMTTIRRWGPRGASEAGDSPRRPLGGDGTLIGGEEEGKALSH